MNYPKPSRYQLLTERLAKNIHAARTILNKIDLKKALKKTNITANVENGTKVDNTTIRTKTRSKSKSKSGTHIAKEGITDGCISAQRIEKCCTHHH